jgi:uroporphyrin-III C-methyltransferase / precorrin-2 dehydrogenase / sirohydrochlorin ferrochelatase
VFAAEHRRSATAVADEAPLSMDYLPLFLDVRARRALVVGGGTVALRKASWLSRAGARVTVVAPRLAPQFADLLARDDFSYLQAEFTAAHLADAVLVVAATDELAVNRAVSQAARTRGIPVNVVDNAELSSFIFPALIDRAPVVVAVSSAGAAPVLARRVREQIEALLPARLGALARFMGAQRQAVSRVLRAGVRRSFWERIAGGPTANAVLAGDERTAQDNFARELRSCELTGTDAAPLGEVYLIGAGPGNADLLTLRALQLLQQADVILYDRLVGAEILERARRDAVRIFVGKECGERGQQERINQLLIDLARRGKRVARLKGGDPFVFGRGGEELEVLARHDIPCTVVPGITAALGAAASAQLPLTHRQLAHSVTLVSGHQVDASASSWRFFADPAHTVVFYMATAQLNALLTRLREAGATASHPAALIERATLEGERVLRGTLGSILAQANAAGLSAPALLVTGAVAAFAPAALVQQVARVGACA